MEPDMDWQYGQWEVSYTAVQDGWDENIRKATVNIIRGYSTLADVRKIIMNVGPWGMKVADITIISMEKMGSEV